MAGTSNLSIFLIGLAAGAGIALIGGLVEHLLHLRRNRETQRGVPGCLVYVMGGLILAGIVAIIVSLIITGTIGPAIILGVGVMIGFYSGFILLVIAWLLIESIRPSSESTVSSDSQLP